MVKHQTEETLSATAVAHQSQLAIGEKNAKALALEHGFEYVKLSEVELSDMVVRLLPQEMVHAHHVIAVRFTGTTLYIAMENPLDLPVIHELNLITGFEIEPMVASQREILQIISTHFGVERQAKQEFIDAEFHHQLSTQEQLGVGELDVSGDAGQIVRLINSIFKDAIESSVSDIHLEPQGDGLYIRFRIDGILKDIMTIPIALMSQVSTRVKVLAHLDITEKRRAQDGHIDIRHNDHEYDMRVSVVPTIAGEKIVIRLLDRQSAFTTLEKIGVGPNEKEELENIIHSPYGMVLVTGPTGSGKTTTQYAMLHTIDAISKNIITVENPVEYTLNRINQIQINTAIGETFASVLKSMLRQDPDVIMVGEIRDGDTAEIAIQAALTGHFVLSTLHTNDSPTAISRLQDLGVAPFLIASGVVMSLAQRLMRQICPECKCEYHPDPIDLASLNMPNIEYQKYYHGQGCDYCFGSGYRGRTGAFEILNIRGEVRDWIAHEKSAGEIKKLAKEKGYLNTTLFESAMQKVYDGVTTVEEIRRVISVD